MKLEKAIGTVEGQDWVTTHHHTSENDEAFKLVIEGAKELSVLRTVLKGLGMSLLPGETFD